MTLLIDIRGGMSLDGVFPALRVGEAYYGRVTASGGTPFYTYQIIDGALPAGLTFDTITGEVTGTPTLNQTSVFTVRATDLQGMYVDVVFVLLATAKVPEPYITSAIYPVQSIESMIATGKASDIRFLTPPMDKVTTSGRTSALTLTATTAYKTYDHHDAMTVTGKTSALSMVVTTAYETYNHHDDMTVTGKTSALSMVVTTNYVNYSNNDAMTVTGKATGVHLA